MTEEISDFIQELQAAIESDSIVPHVTPAEIREHLEAHYDFKKSVSIDTVFADTKRMLAKWQVQVTHPRYFGLFNPSVTLPSILADLLVATYNPQLAAWRTSPAANEIERHTLRWLAAKFGFPGDSAANFTSGGAEANLSSVIVALTRHFPEFGDRGLRSLRNQPKLYLSREAHHSFKKIAHMTGLGREAIQTVATDEDLKLDLKDLARQVDLDKQNGMAPFMVVGTAGTTAAGVIDPLSALAGFCQRERLWFHVDAAWGGAAIISPMLRKHLAGIEAADSITCDAHKWFSVPMGAGMFFCRHPDAVAEAFRAETSYMPGKASGLTSDPYTSSVQWSRRFIGLKLFLSLSHFGEEAYAGLIEHQVRMGELLRSLLESAGWRIVNRTPFPLVCFTREGLRVDEFLGTLYERQTAWISQVRIGGAAPVLRACITSFRTAEADVRFVAEEITRIAAEQ